MAKIPIWMDLIAGILLAYDLFPKFGKLSRFHNWIRGYLKKIDTRNFTNIKTMIFSGAVSIFIFLMLLLWVYYKNSGQLEYNVWAEIGCFFLGIVVAWVVITLLAKLFKSLGVFGIFIIGLILSVLTLIIVFPLHPSSGLAASSASFLYICILYPFAMIIANNVQRILLADEKKQFYIFALIGLVLFGVSKIFELTV
jgi:predicted neutral ceramidase superfamily lipid hydrolase